MAERTIRPSIVQRVTSRFSRSASALRADLRHIRGNVRSRGRPSWTQVAAALAAAFAIVVLCGWWFHVPILTTPRPSWLSTKPNSALGILVLSASLWVLSQKAPSRSQTLTGIALAALAAILGALTLAEDLYRIDLGLDGLLIPGPTDRLAHVARMAPSMSAALILLGCAVLLLDTETAHGSRPTELLVTVVILAVLPRLVGYAYGLVPTSRSPATVMAPYETLMLMLVTTGMLAARSDRGVVSILRARSEAGRAGRRLVPSALLVPFILGGIAVLAAAGGIIRTAYVAPLAISTVIIAFVAIGFFSAWTSMRAEVARERNMQRLQAQHSVTQALIESASVSQAASRFLASLGEALGWDFAALWRKRPGDGILECEQVWHRAGVDVTAFETMTQGLRLAPAVELPGMVWLNEEPTWVPDIQRTPSLRASAAAASELHAGFAFPIRYAGDIQGVIEFFGRSSRDVDRDLVGAAPILGSQIGEALQRKRAEELLRASEDRFRAVAESARDALVTVDASGIIRYANPAAEQMFGYREGEIVRKPLSFLVKHSSVFDQELKGHLVESTALCASGAELPVELSVARWSTAEGVFFTAIIRDVSVRKEAEKALRDARDAAEASTRELEAFSYSVSHDLRAPVRSIDGFSQALLEDYGEKLGAEGRDNLFRVRGAAEKMSHLIDDLLELSRTSRVVLHHEVVDLSAMAREIADELRQANPERQVELVIADHVLSWGDARLLQVVLQNLLDNAWKFTARNQQARIEFGQVAGTGTEGVYFVRDDGVGFDNAFAGRLFSPFQRLHEAEDFPGTGVGLALAQRIVTRHGGRIWGESEVGKGATFFLTLPVPSGESEG